MVNRFKASQQEDASYENEKETTILNSAVKYREESLEYNELRNQVEQEYYYKIHGCSVKAQE
jgi:hypothetical protein